MKSAKLAGFTVHLLGPDKEFQGTNTERHRRSDLPPKGEAGTGQNGSTASNILRLYCPQMWVKGPYKDTVRLSDA